MIGSTTGHQRTKSTHFRESFVSVQENFEKDLLEIRAGFSSPFHFENFADFQAAEIVKQQNFDSDIYKYMQEETISFYT